jgi:SulP family sulfate permease
LQFGQISVLGTGALAVAIIALIEAASIARAISLRSRQRIDGNQEFIGQGLSNLVGSLFSCFVGSGSFTRSGVNYDSGAKTPLAALFAAVILALIILLAPQMTAYLPMPVMGGIVILIAWNLIDTHHVRQIIRVSKEEATILLVTFSATLLFPLEFAIYAGVILSIALFLRHSAKPRLTAVVPIPYRAGTPLRSAYRHQLTECDQVKILRLDGELFFGSITHIQNEIRQLCDDQSFKHLLLVGSGVNYIDLAGAEMLAEESQRLKAAGITLHLSNFKGGALKTLKHGNFEHSIGKHHIHVSHHVALMTILPELQCNCPRSEYNEQPGCIIYQAYGHRTNDSCFEDLVYTPGTSTSSGLTP